MRGPGLKTEKITNKKCHDLNIFSLLGTEKKLEKMSLGKIISTV